MDKASNQTIAFVVIVSGGPKSVTSRLARAPAGGRRPWRSDRGRAHLGELATIRAIECPMRYGRKHQSLKELLQFDNWCELLVQRVFFRGTSLQVHRIGDLEMVVDHRGSDTASIRTCLATDMYSRFLPLMKLPATVRALDIGANVGGFSLMLCARGIAVQRLVCVEMNPNTYERLRFNIRNNLNRLCIDNEVVNAALCNESKEIKVRLGIGSTGDSIHRGSRANGWTREYSIVGLTFDQIVSRYMGDGTIDICKIDIEGAENEALAVAGCQCETLRRCRYLLIEIHHVAQYDSFLVALRQCGLRHIADEGKNKCGVHLFGNEQFVQLPP